MKPLLFFVMVAVTSLAAQAESMNPFEANRLCNLSGDTESAACQLRQLLPQRNGLEIKCEASPGSWFTSKEQKAKALAIKQENCRQRDEMNEKINEMTRKAREEVADSSDAVDHEEPVQTAQPEELPGADDNSG